MPKIKMGIDNHVDNPHMSDPNAINLELFV
jgi:hypothetical protein